MIKERPSARRKDSFKCAFSGGRMGNGCVCFVYWAIGYISNVGCCSPFSRVLLCVLLCCASSGYWSRSGFRPVYTRMSVTSISWKYSTVVPTREAGRCFARSPLWCRCFRLRIVVLLLNSSARQKKNEGRRYAADLIEV